MPVSATQYLIVRELFEHGLLPKNGALLEIGEAHWCNNANPLDMVGDIKRLITEPARRDALVNRLEAIVDKREPGMGFDVAQVFYELFFAPLEMRAVDFQGSRRALRLALNGPLALDRRFDVVLNQRTAEHVFNIAQVFKTIHDYTTPLGMMIHESTLSGWTDNGFYILQPTLFFDLAEINHYQMCGMFIEDTARGTTHRITTRNDVYEFAEAGQIPDGSLLFTVLTKSAVDREFAFPMQGYYRNTLGTIGMEAWRYLR